MQEKKVKAVKLFSAALLSMAVLYQGTVAARVQGIQEYRMEQVVVTGTKSKRVLSDVPVRTEVITAEDLELKGAVNLYEALDGVPGIRVEEQCSYCNFSMVRMQGLSGDNVQILIDGQPIYTGLAAVYGLQQIPASSIERIEVVKGAGSALYGSKAVSGVINVITKKPGKKPSLEVATSLGTHNTNNYSMNASARFNEKVDILITGQKSSGDIIDENQDMASDRVWSNNMSNTFKVNIHDIFGRDVIQVNGRFIEEARKGGELPDAYLNPFNEGSEHINTIRQEASLGYSRDFDAGQACDFNFTYTRHNRDATNDTFLGDFLDINGNYPTSDLLLPYLAGETLYFADTNFTQPFTAGGEHRLLGGVSFSHNYLKESGMYVIVDDTDPNYGSPYKSHSFKEADDWGLYIQDEWALMENLELVIGGRYDRHKSKSIFSGGEELGLLPRELVFEADSFMPRSGLMVKPLPEMTVRAAIGQGFRVPFGFAEDLHLCSGSPRVFKSENLKAEKSISYNASIDYGRAWYNLSLNIFRTDLTDKIDLADAEDGSPAASLGYDYVWENLGKAYTQGLELGAELSPLNNLILKADFTCTDAQYQEARGDWENHPVHGDKYFADSKYISRVPQFSAGADVVAQPGSWKFFAGLDLIGPQYIDYNANDDVEDPASEIVKTDSYMIMNLSAAYTFQEIGLTLLAGAKNLWDERQTDKRPDDAAFIYKPLTGRILYAGAKIAF